MKDWHLTMVLMALLAAVFTGQLLQTTAKNNDVYFDCRRQGLDCEIGGVCTAHGTCMCRENYSDILGQCVREEVADITCINDTYCQNGGQCRVVGTEDVCFCPDAFSGTRCHLRRLEVKCHSQGIDIKVRPHKGFVGMISSRHQPADECRLREAKENDSTGAIFENSFPFDFGDQYCGITTALTNASRMYRMDLIVQYTPYIVFNTDQLLTATCLFSKTGQVVAQMGQPYIDSDNLTKAEEAMDVTPLTLDIRDKNGSRLRETSPVVVGDEIDLVVTLQDNAAFTKYRIQDVSSSNGRDKFVLVEKSCPKKHQVVRSQFSVLGNATTAVSIPIYAFKFISGNVVYFQVVVVMCEDDSKACDSVACANPNLDSKRLRRQRRAASDEVLLTGQMQVLLTGEISQDTTEVVHESDTEDCLQHPQVQMMAILLGAAVAALATACVTVFVCLWHRGPHPEDDKPATSPSHSSVALTQTFSIPRAKFDTTSNLPSGLAVSLSAAQLDA